MSRNLILFTVLAFASVGNAETLYSTKDKTYGQADLPTALQQALHEIEMQRYREVQALTEQALLDTYFSDKAKAEKKTKEEIEADEMKVAPASDKEVKKFYDENKAKIPPNYTFDQVKGEIQRILAGQKSGEKRQALLKKVKDAKGYKFALNEPLAPKVAINTASAYTKGKSGAKVQIVEFADYQCPHCKHASETLRQLMKNYESKVELFYMDFPINRSGISRIVAEGAFCAGKQKKYWEFHHMAFDRQTQLNKDSPEAFAKELKLDLNAYKTCLGSAEAKAFVTTAKEEGDRVGVSGTPSIYINGQKYSGGNELGDIKKAIDKLL